MSFNDKSCVVWFLHQASVGKFITLFKLAGGRAVISLISKDSSSLA